MAVEEPAQDVVVPAEESDDEYQVIAKKPKTVETPQEAPAVTQPMPVSTEPVIVDAGAAGQDVDAAMQDVTDAITADQPAATDDDWLRSRTNRLLDLVEDDDLPIAPASAPTKPAAEKRDLPAAVEVQPASTQTVNDPVMDATLSEEDKIRDTGRLYLRNLHFEIAEEDIRTQFSKYGSLVEVSSRHFFFMPLALG